MDKYCDWDSLKEASCDLSDVQVSDDGKELAGATVDVYQAAEYPGSYGVMIQSFVSGRNREASV